MNKRKDIYSPRKGTLKEEKSMKKEIDSPREGNLKEEKRERLSEKVELKRGGVSVQ